MYITCTLSRTGRACFVIVDATWHLMVILAMTRKVFSGADSAGWFLSALFCNVEELLAVVALWWCLPFAKGLYSDSEEEYPLDFGDVSGCSCLLDPPRTLGMVCHLGISCSWRPGSGSPRV